MGLDVFFKKDIENAVAGLEHAAQYQKPDDFQAGFLAVLQAVRATFGLPQTTLVVPEIEGTKVHRP